MSTDLVAKPEDKVTISQDWEKAMIDNDLSGLDPEDRLRFVKHICETVGLNPSTRPFVYTKFNNELKLYPGKGAAEQLRSIHKISCEIVKQERDESNGILLTHVKGTTKDRFDEDFGWAAIANLKGDLYGNAIGKSVTKAKRRVTLSMVGLGWMLPDNEHEKHGEEGLDNSVDGPTVVNLQSALAAPVEAEEKPKKKRTRKKKDKKEEEFQTIEHPIYDSNEKDIDTGVPKNEQSTQEEIEAFVKRDEKIQEVKEVLNKEPENYKTPKEESDDANYNNPDQQPEPKVNAPEIKPIPGESLDQTMDLINKSKHIETLDYLEKCAAVSVTLDEGSIALLHDLIDNRRDVLTHRDRSDRLDGTDEVF